MAIAKTWKFTGYKWSNVPTYADWDKDRKYPQYAIIAEQHFKINFNRPCTMEEAELYFIDKHPEWAIGFGCNNEFGDFSCHCVKSYYISEFGEISEAEMIKKIRESVANRKKVV